jgi:PAS domain S-box-containing protein
VSQSSLHTQLLRYGVALLSAVLAVFIRGLLTPLWGGQLPFLTLFPAVLVSAWYGGLGPGLVTTALCAAAAAYLWLTPLYSLDVAQPADVIGLVLAVLVMLLISWLTAARQRSEEAERMQREQFQVTLTSIGDAVIVTDAEGWVTFMNPTAQTLTGWHQEAVGQPLSTIFVIANEETRQPVEDPVAKVLRAGMVVGLANHTILRAKDGREIPIADSGAPVRDLQGRIRGVVLVFHDVTEQRRAEDALRRAHEELENRVQERTAALIQANAALQTEITTRKEIEAALRESEERFRLFMDYNPAIAWMKDEQGRHVYLNKTYEQRFGVRLTDWRGKTDRDLWPPEIAEVFQKNDHAVLAAGKPLEVLENTRNPDGAQCTWWSFKFPFQDAAGKQYVAGIGVDITARLRAEEALRTLNADLDQRVQKRTADLTRANADLRQVAYIFAHDLQEPVRQMGIYTQKLAKRYEGSFDTETREAVAFIVEGAKRMRAQFTDLIHYLEVDEQGSVRSTTNCEEVLRLVLEALQESITTSAAVVTHDPLPTIEANAAQLQLVFYELLDNALKFRNLVPPQVHVWAEREERDWRFAVRDHGIGIDLHGAGQLFGFFRRLHPRQQYPGTGMGLAICKKIVEHHGGRIWVESAPGEGTTVLFTIQDRL